MISDGSMPEARAKRILLQLDNRTIARGEDIVECLAALSQLFPQDIQKTAPDGRPLRDVLRTFAAPSRLEWLLNYRRARQHLIRKDADFLAVGTTTNEALHKELNHAFDQVHRLYKSTLHLRLRIFHLYKLIPHNRAMYGRAVRTACQQLVLHRAIDAVRPWSSTEWRRWCSALAPRERAALPLAAKRKFDARLVRQARRTAMCRPAASEAVLLRRPAAALLRHVSTARLPRKQTPFARKGRTGGLARMTKVVKRPAAKQGNKRTGVLKRPTGAAR